MTTLVLGIDIGGTGVRGTLARIDAGEPTPVASRGVSAATRWNRDGMDPAATWHTTRALIDALTAGRHVAAVAVGSTGMSLLGGGLRATLPGRILDTTAARTVVLCSDVLTSYLGALGLNGGAVVAAGTGAVALGTDLRGTWKRADGWGHLLGDAGGGAWIGQVAIDAALRAQDGRPGGSPPLLAALTNRFGSVPDAVHAISSRPDRQGLLAGFVPDIAALSEDDTVARRILTRAGAHLADTLLAALPDGAPPRAALTGNLFRASDVLTAGLVRRLTRRAPRIDLVPARGCALDGAVTLAAAALHGTIPAGADVHLYHATGAATAA